MRISKKELFNFLSKHQLTAILHEYYNFLFNNIIVMYIICYIMFILLNGKLE